MEYEMVEDSSEEAEDEDVHVVSREESDISEGHEVGSQPSEGEDGEESDDEVDEEHQNDVGIESQPTHRGRNAEETVAEDLASAIKKSRDHDRNKGIAVSRQLVSTGL
jgi:hypothetical protein